ncbi:hypothetical protein VNO77_38939 [Canavalia gladiata]|uniref:Uncharacterized protein n=1 Tax=Canavalia gladiata TaxID=3824 RepID=A0AAN9PXS9_CANGL
MNFALFLLGRVPRDKVALVRVVWEWAHLLVRGVRCYVPGFGYTDRPSIRDHQVQPASTTNSITFEPSKISNHGGMLDVTLPESSRKISLSRSLILLV